MAISADANTVLTYKAAALDLAALNLAVFPLAPKSKIPHKGSRGFKDAAKDEATICEAWKKQPYSNIGIATGTPSGIIVLDCDSEEAFDEAARRGLPTTWIVKTSRGYQVYLRRPAWANVPTIPQDDPDKERFDMGIPGAEIKADGGYVVAPPSVHPDGPVYRWEVSPDEAPLGDAPDWLLDILRAKLSKRTPQATQPTPAPVAASGDAGAQALFNSCVEAVRTASQGSRNNTLNDAAYKVGGLVGAGRLSQGDAEAALLSAALACGLEEVAARKTIASGLNAGIAKPLESRPAPVLRLVPNGPIERQPADGYNLTDLGNAERLVARHGQDLRYCHVWGKWLVWDGRRWAIDATGEVERRAKATIRAIYSEAAAIVGDDEASKAQRRALASWAGKSESRGKLEAMIKQAASEPGVAVDPNDLDRDPWLLTVLNGTLDLRTGQLRPHNRADMITRLAPVEYHPDAGAPLWGDFLARIMDNRAGVIEFLQRAVGYSLTGDTSERCMFIAHGNGANGKSTFVETLAAALGDYSLTTPAETLMIKRDTGIPNDVARLRGARFVSASETEEGRRLAESLVKRLTGGTDQVSARFLHGEFFDFRPVGKFWLSTNHRPTIRGTDNAIWSRIRLIPFDVTIPSSEQDKRLPAKLKTELAGILAWAVAGCLAWQREGLDAPAEVEAAGEAYRTEQDQLAGWLAECCEQNPNAWTAARAAFDSFKDYAPDVRITQTEFGRRLREKDFAQAKQGNTRGWLGFRLLDSDAGTRLLPGTG